MDEHQLSQIPQSRQARSGKATFLTSINYRWQIICPDYKMRSSPRHPAGTMEEKLTYVRSTKIKLRCTSRQLLNCSLQNVRGSPAPIPLVPSADFSSTVPFLCCFVLDSPLLGLLWFAQICILLLFHFGFTRRGSKINWRLYSLLQMSVTSFPWFAPIPYALINH